MLSTKEGYLSYARPPCCYDDKTGSVVQNPTTGRAKRDADSSLMWFPWARFTGGIRDAHSVSPKANFETIGGSHLCGLGVTRQSGGRDVAQGVLYAMAERLVFSHLQANRSEP